MEKKRLNYIQALYTKEPNIYDIHSKYIEWEHQIRKTDQDINKLFELLPPKGKENEHEIAVERIFMESGLFRDIQSYYNNKGYDDMNNLADVPVEELKIKIESLMLDVIGEKIDTNKHSAMKHEEEGKSFMCDISYFQQKLKSINFSF